MSSQTKILVLHRRIFIYTLLAILLVILCVIILYFSFNQTTTNQLQTAASFEDVSSQDSLGESTAMQSQTAAYIPGVYQSDVRLGESVFEVCIYLDADHINSIHLLPTDETVSTMYPLLNTTIDELTEKIIAAQTIENISYSTEYRYTSLSILNAIQHTLEKAAIPQNSLE